MTYMDIEFPGDAEDRRARSGRNINDVEQWGSLAVGVALLVYGLSRLRKGGWLMAALGGMLVQRGTTAHCHVYEAFGINTAGTGDDTRRALGGPAGVIVEETVTINRPVEELYRFWRNLENLPSFMDHVEAVEGNGNGRTHWKVKAPAGTTVEWDAELIEDRPGEALVWRSVEGSGVQNSGAVRFVDAPRNQGTEVHVEFDYGVPGGRLAEAVAKLFGEEPTQQAKDDLRRFKQVLETGFVVISEGSPEGSTARRHLVQRPGQPPEEAPPQQPSDTAVRFGGEDGEGPPHDGERAREEGGAQ
jgi:uncharacterized membrane protein